MPAATHTEWRTVPNDPDPRDDLGYDLIDLDILPTNVEGRSQILVLPTDEDLLRENAFIVADEPLLRDLDSMV
jgi:hypothetical protein